MPWRLKVAGAETKSSWATPQIWGYDLERSITMFCRVMFQTAQRRGAALSQEEKDSLVAYLLTL